MVTLIHEWLLAPGGAERVWSSFGEVWPGAQKLSGYGHPTNANVRFSPLNRIFTDRIGFDIYRAMSPWAIHALGEVRDDLVVSDGHSGMLWANVIATSRWVHYCHTPSRFIWRPDLLAGPRGRISPLAIFGALLREGDRKRAQRPDLLISNSSAVQRRVEDFYRRESPILHPPVDTAFFTPGRPTQSGYLLIVSRLMRYKKIEQALLALSGSPWKVIVVGEGPERRSLQTAFTASNIKFVGRVAEKELRELYRGALALVVPGEEDFCLAAVEAMSCGTPVVGLAKGGLLDSVVDGITGVLVRSMEARVLLDACRQVEATRWSKERLAQHASRFSSEQFKKHIKIYALDA